MFKFLTLLVALSVCQAVPSDLHSRWSDFKLKYGKQYKSHEEESYRLQVFLAKLKEIEENNKLYYAGFPTYKKGITEWSDWTHEEFANRTRIYFEIPKWNESAVNIYQAADNEVLLDHVDWREKNAVNEVRSQKDCGSCWAFAAVDAIESMNYIKYGKMLTLSPQNLVDCSRPYGTHGCVSGAIDKSYDYIKDKGIMLDSDYPYTAQDDQCKFKPEKSALKVTGYNWVRGFKSHLKSAIAKFGPVGISVDSKEWDDYEGGIFRAKEPFRQIDHAVVAVGYGSEKGVQYWIFKSSNGKGFGEDGYIRVAINEGEDIGILYYPVFPTLD